MKGHSSNSCYFQVCWQGFIGRVEWRQLDESIITCQQWGGISSNIEGTVTARPDGDAVCSCHNMHPLALFYPE